MEDVNAVVQAQAYIGAHYADADFGIESVCRGAGYSRRQLDRLFQKHLHMTLYACINAVLLSESAAQLLETEDQVIDVALDCHFQSHEGFTRSFAKRFFITPREYRRRKIAIPLFTQHPANHYYILKGGQAMETTAICTVTPVTRPKRKLLYLPSHAATGYFDYCEEMGCQWEGLLNSIPERFDAAALLELPDHLRPAGESRIASGVEVPLDYEKPLPDGYRSAVLPECVMLYFQSEPYENPDDFGAVIAQVLKAIEKYDLERWGWRPANRIAPTFNLGAEPKTGARIAIPVVKK